MEFAIGFAATLLLIAAWKAVGWVLELGRKVAALQGTRGIMGSEALLDLVERIARLERRTAEIDLTVMDTAEKVAHKLQDRQRKRAAAEEIGDVDEIPNDPNLLLARGRAAYPLHQGSLALDGRE